MTFSLDVQARPIKSDSPVEHWLNVAADISLPFINYPVKGGKIGLGITWLIDDDTGEIKPVLATLPCVANPVMAFLVTPLLITPNDSE